MILLLWAVQAADESVCGQQELHNCSVIESVSEHEREERVDLSSMRNNLGDWISMRDIKAKFSKDYEPIDDETLPDNLAQVIADAELKLKANLVEVSLQRHIELETTYRKDRGKFIDRLEKALYLLNNRNDDSVLQELLNLNDFRFLDVWIGSFRHIRNNDIKIRIRKSLKSFWKWGVPLCYSKRVEILLVLDREWERLRDDQMALDVFNIALCAVIPFRLYEHIESMLKYIVSLSELAVKDRCLCGEEKRRAQIQMARFVYTFYYKRRSDNPLKLDLLKHFNPLLTKAMKSVRKRIETTSAKQLMCARKAMCISPFKWVNDAFGDINIMYKVGEYLWLGAFRIKRLIELQSQLYDEQESVRQSFSRGERSALEKMFELKTDEIAVEEKRDRDCIEKMEREHKNVCEVGSGMLALPEQETEARKSIEQENKGAWVTLKAMNEKAVLRELELSGRQDAEAVARMELARSFIEFVGE